MPSVAGPLKGTEVHYVENPEFNPQFEAAVMNAVSELADYAARSARSHAVAYGSLSVPGEITATPVHLSGPYLQSEVVLRKPGFVGHFMEKGTKARYARKRKGKRLATRAYRGQMPAMPFMKPAEEEAAARSLDIRIP